MAKKYSAQVQLVLDILRDEIAGDQVAALQKLAKDYTMTWVYQKNSGVLFPTTKKNVRAELAEVYPIKGREYDIKHIAEGDDVVMIEMIESYPDPQTKKIYRTPLVIVLELKEGKIRTGRHYADPAVSHLFLTKSQVAKAYKNSMGSIEVLK
jgi:ketosteroid isomerase-like protein